MSNSLIKAISSNFAEPTLLELALTKEVAAAAISCGLERRKFIPFEGLVGTILNSSPLSAFPKKESLKPSVSKTSLPCTGSVKLGAVIVQRFVSSL